MLLQIRTKVRINPGTAHGNPADSWCSGTSPGRVPGTPDDPCTAPPFSPSQGRAPFRSLLQVAPRPIARSFLRRSRNPLKPEGPGASCAAHAVAGTPAAVAAATASLTPIAEQGARSSQGRSHVDAA